MANWESKVAYWAAERNLLEGSTPSRQLAKLIEELSELTLAIANQNGAEIEDSIGDMAVVLCIIARQCGLSFNDCLDAAWDQIKDRKGRMVDGVFVKEPS